LSPLEDYSQENIWMMESEIYVDPVISSIEVKKISIDNITQYKALSIIG